MTTKTPKRFKGNIRDVYLELIQAYPLISIRSESELKEAQAVMDRLFAKGSLSAGEEIYVDALSDLVATYEDDHCLIEPASDAEMLRHLMEAKGITQVELHLRTSIAKSTISEILAGRKPFSRKIIRRLADYFEIETSVLAGNI
ncbi:MAG: type II toxin-antitoxin system HigA family antitoxin [Planctomycetaceae bacterium]